jgi:CDP-diacylglycerol---glycerol-3-phosphate 3-phosphatidyltransferase
VHATLDYKTLAFLRAFFYSKAATYNRNTELMRTQSASRYNSPTHQETALASTYQLKSAFQNLLRPLAGWLFREGITANQLTIAAAVLSTGYGILLWLLPSATALWVALPLVLLLRLALNTLAGMFAQEFGQESKLGGFINELCDIVSDAALILGFAGLAPNLVMLCALFAVAAALSETAGVCAQVCGASRRHDGPMGKHDRAVLLGVLGAGLGAHLIGPGMVLGVFIPATVAALWTTVRRVRGALAEVQ